MSDHYTLLGLQKAAGDADIRRAYKKAALQWHPDKNPSRRAEAEQMFKKIAEAYRVLSDPHRRADYDRSLQAPSSKPPQQQQQQQQPFKNPGPVQNRSSSVAKDDNMEDAYSLFEEFFGGRDPFKDFDAIFEDPSSADFDWIFASLNSKRGSSSSVAAPAKNAAPATKARPSTRIVRVRCIGRRGGVAWRRSPNLADRLEHIKGPENGDLLTGWLHQGDWLQAKDGWLPLAINGEPVFQVLPETGVWQVRCISQQGVAFRRTMHMDDRIADVRGPDQGAILTVEEVRGGSWVRTAHGWLPLVVAGSPVFVFVEEAEQSRRTEGEKKPDNPSWGNWSLLPGLPYRLLAVLGASGYVSLRVARMAFSLWWKTWFRFLPSFWT